jgi:hypothetical protein
MRNKEEDAIMVDLNRFGISALEKDRKAEALNEEMLSNKMTGEFLIKTPDGNVISYSSMSRFKNHINHIEIVAINADVIGDLGQIVPGTIELPDIVASDLNLLDTAIVKVGNVKKLILSVDMDCVEILGIDTIPVIDEPSLSIDFKYDGVATTFNVTRLMSELNESPIIVPDQSNTGIEIQSIKIVANAANATKTIKNIVHSILIVI